MFLCERIIISLMSFYPDSDSCITNKVKVVLDLSNYATKK